jgi:hypothetical protein
MPILFFSSQLLLWDCKYRLCFFFHLLFIQLYFITYTIGICVHIDFVIKETKKEDGKK